MGTDAARRSRGALIAGLLVLAGGLWHGRIDARNLRPGGMGALTATAPSGFVGSAACTSCHPKEAAAWAGSDHAHAMAAAVPGTVLGDFSGIRIEHLGATARFSREGDRFLIETEGRDGKVATFPVSHTFGWTPLQQYLVGFPDGRLQTLPWAWDGRPQAQGGQRWFHVYGAQPIPSGDPLHWTGRQQTWNFMCAECHSTAVSKGYDAASDTYRTTFSEISVGCESCHGAARGHVAWAEAPVRSGDGLKGFAGTWARRPAPDWSPDPATGSPARGVARPPGDEVEVCARCHARRGTISEDWRPGAPSTATHLPALLTEGLFEVDGQMRDEVFNDHAFKQSRMYAKGVICSDCHDPHSGRLKADGAQVCAQCHQPARFAAASHTGHAPAPGAPDCIDCHMPARTYMVVDKRHDHAFRVPRPDLSVALGTPNTCNACHADKPAQWAADAVARWHGPERKGFQTYGDVFHLARSGNPAARAPLVALAGDPLVPAVARATALGELANFPASATETTIREGLRDPDPLVRIVALRAMAPWPGDARLRWGGHLLADAVLGVRAEAGRVMADIPLHGLADTLRARLQAAFAAYEATQRLNADRPESRANLANFLTRRGRFDEAEQELRAGLTLDPDAAELTVNLADLYRRTQRDPAAALALRQVISRTPEAASLHHALGLTLVRLKRYDEALAQLAQAAERAPEDAGITYTYAVALQSLGQGEAGRVVLSKALERNPWNARLLGALLTDAITRRDVPNAAALAGRLTALRLDDEELARFVKRLSPP